MAPGSPILANPRLVPSQLEFRIDLARRRTAAYPLDSMDFIMMDLERPELCTRHAHWCTGDLTGRLLEFLSCAEGVDGRHDPRLGELFERILRTRRRSGLFGRYAPVANATDPPEDHPFAGVERLFSGFLRYFDAFGDWRAVEAASGIAEHILSRKDAWVAMVRGSAANPIEAWVTEHFARLWRVTRDDRYADFCAAIGEAIHTCINSHSHGFMSSMRGLQLMALFSGDAAWNEKPERFRRLIVDEGYEGADGCIAEMFPRNFRNEGCSIADWLMMNLNAAAIADDPFAYDRAENILLNALYLNQYVTGGFGHRELRPWGYATTGEEAWWCCTEHAGMALTEVARHAVTFDGVTLRINFLVPGRFTIPMSGAPDIEIAIATSYPAKAEAVVTVRNLPDDAEAALRVPPSIVDPQIGRAVGEDGLRLHLTGKLGHWLEERPDGVILRYGPLVLAPSIYYWNTEHEEVDSSVPAGYIPAFLPPGLPRLKLEDVLDPDTGMVEIEPASLPDWTYFDEGPNARCAVEGASAMVPVRFDNGDERTLRFTPLCANTSTLLLLDTPILFPGIC